ncbi:pre-peptidase C-terminal domain-containing protein [Nostoc sp. PCC 7107]|uniref:pre-peptidase C-terminal domain-containing protein n=1 Tax=Nostoc sp. PCC 7107 TaxID=317936 RepID=UPI00029EECA8|nr:pre-peptidase C-terminal domain-containing protein [Nostoc sp. PCC 7107]AFY42497.1 Subtilisin [Nostoc sp. PCC 7107]
MDTFHSNTNEHLPFPDSLTNQLDPLQNPLQNLSKQQLGQSQTSASLAIALDFIESKLQEFAQTPNAYEKLNFVFDIKNASAVATRLADWQNKVFTDRPDILFLSNAELQGAVGAYSAERNTIYLSETLTQQDPLTGLAKVLLEEYGHALDQQFNSGGDTPGDEGELLSQIVLGQAISDQELARLRGEDDRGTLNLDGVDVAVEFDNTIGTAVNVGTLSGNRTYSGSVGSADTNDYYRFTLGTASNFRLNLSGLSADADVELLNSSGVAIASSLNSGSNSESISSHLTAGNYYVRVYPYSSTTTSYNLSLTASADAGNSLTLARNIGTLSSTQTFNDFVGTTDTNDYYRFTLGTASNFRLNLSGLSADADVELLNSSGATIQSSALSGTTSESINSHLAAGNYYVRVYPYGSANTSYNLSLTASADAGNSLTLARNIGTLSSTQTFNDFVGTTDTNDYYRFTLGTASNFRLNLSGLSDDADVVLLNSSGATIQSSALSGTTSESINSHLAAGNYYVRVYPYGSANTSYSLSLTASADAGNSLTLARNIGTLSSTQTFNDFVGSTDTNDYYRFTLGTASNFSLNLSGLSDDADVVLLNSSGATIQSSALAGTASENISRQLTAGNYYVRVYPYSGNTNYTLALSATAIPTIVDNAGNTLATARNIGNLSSSRSFQDFVGSIDTNDYYRFALTQSSNFSLALNGLSADADVQLLNSTGGVIVSSAASGSSAESINRQLTAGTYYVRVYPYSGNTNYNLTLAATAVSQPDGAGNTLATARNVGTLSSSQSFQDFVGTIDTNDYYRFNLTQTSNFNLLLNGLSSDADVQLLNSTGGLIQGSYGESSLSESITRTLNAGTYYIRVYPYTSSTNYNLTLSAAAVTLTDGAGNTLAAARNIGTLTGSRTFQDFVGSSDTNDYYRFNVTQNSNFSLALSGLNADADVQLLNSSGQIIASSVASGLGTELITRTLATGTYYVRVYPFSTGNTNYQLVLTANAAGNFNSTYGYGLVNAAAAVARAIGQTTPFADVANLGGNNWGNDLVNSPEAWARGYTGQGVVVAVIDSGVDINHSDLRNNIWRNAGEIAGNGIDDDRNGYIDDVNGWNFGQNQNNNNILPGTTSRGQTHGTHVAGTIAASNNGVGITGVAHQSRIMAIRMGDVDDQGRFTNAGSLAAAIRYAVDNGANVINMSLGWSDSTELRDALAYAASRNVITVSAAGNSSLASPGTPAYYATQYGLSVGAIDINRNIASFSNRAGTNNAIQHIVAPGVQIYSTIPGDSYGFSSGTSMAAPHVAGVVALMLSANRNLTHAQVRSILTDSSVRLF